MEHGKLQYQVGGYTPLQQTQAAFVPTYMGTNLESAKEYGKDLLNTYKTNIEDLSKIDIANAQRRVVEGDTAESAAYDAKLKSEMEAMAKKGDYENMTMQVNELARRHVNDKGIKAMAESRAIADEEDKINTQLRAKGIQPWFTADRAKHKTVTYDDNGNPVYNVYKNLSETPMEHDKIRREYWDNLKPDMKPLDAAGVAALQQDLNGYITTGEWTGVSDTKVRDQFKEVLNMYKNTPSFDQDTRHEMSLDPNLTREQAEAMVGSKLLSEGLTRVYEGKKLDYHRDYSLEDAARKKAAEKEEEPGTPYATADTIGTTNPLVASTKDLDERGISTAKQIPIIINDKTGVPLTPEESKHLQYQLKWASDHDASKKLNVGDDDKRRAAFIAETKKKGYTTTFQYEDPNEAVKNEEFKKNVTAADNVIKQLLIEDENDPNYISDKATRESIKKAYPDYAKLSPETRQKVLVDIQKQMSANRQTVNTKVILSDKKEITDQAKIDDYMTGVGVVSGRRIGIGATAEEGGGTYESKGGWPEIQNKLKDAAEARGLNTDRKLRYSVTKQGVSEGNPYNIPGATVSLVTIDDGSKTVQIPIFSQPNDQVGELMKGLNDVYSVSATAKSGKKNVDVGFGKGREVVVENYPTYENGKWESKTRIKIPDDVAEKAGYKDSYLTYKEFAKLWDGLYGKKIKSYNVFAQ